MDLLEKMATYVRVIETGSFSSAAKHLKVTPGAVSRQVAALEADLHVTLIARSTRSMSATAEGHRYYEKCLRVLREVADAQAIGEDQGVDGLVRMSAPVSFGLAALVPQLTALRETHPGLRVELRVEDRLLDNVLEGMDLAIRGGAVVPVTGTIVARRLTAFAFALVASPAYLERRPAPRVPEDLVRHQTLSCHLAAGEDVWRLAHGARKVSVLINETTAFRCNALHAVRDLAVAGHGVALLPDWLVADDLARGRLVAVLAGWTTEPFIVSAIYRTTERGNPCVRAVVDHLVEGFRPRAAKPRRAG